MGGGGNNNVASELDAVLEIVKSTKKENMSQYHQDLLRWSRNVDKRYAWVLLGALFIMMAATLGPYRVYGLIYAKVTTEGIYTREEASWPVSMIFTIENTIGPLISIIVYYISFRTSMLIGGILLALGNGLAAYSDSLILDVLLIGCVQGVGAAFIFMPFMEVINSYFVKYRNAALGFALCGGTISIFVLSPIFRWMLDTQPWRNSYLGLGACCCLIILMVPFLKPNPRPKPPLDPNRNQTKKKLEGTLSRVSVNALSYQNSVRRQSTILISRQHSTLGRQASVVSVNPFASTAGLERKISRVISESIQHQPKGCVQQTIEEQAASAATQPNEAISLSEVGQDSTFKVSIVLDILKTPGFHIIWYLELLYFWLFSIYCLVLVDYGIDQGCTREEANNLLSFQSVGEIIGRMVLTLLVDNCPLNCKTIVILNLLTVCGLLIGVTYAHGYLAMAIFTVCINSFISLLYILLNGLLVGFLGEEQVTIGYGMASSVVGYLIIFRPQAVGYFRDEIGSYDMLMVSLGIGAAFGAVLCILEPLITRLVAKKEETISS